MPPLPQFVHDLAAELKRHCCRVNHSDKDIARCPRCSALAAYAAWVAIVQEAGVVHRCANCGQPDSECDGYNCTKRAADDARRPPTEIQRGGEDE